MTATGNARSEKPDLMILNLSLPAGDGYLVLERFRGNIEVVNFPAIALPLRDEHGHKDRVWAPGAKADLQKR